MLFLSGTHGRVVDGNLNNRGGGGVRTQLPLCKKGTGRRGQLPLPGGVGGKGGSGSMCLPLACAFRVYKGMRDV